MQPVDEHPIYAKFFDTKVLAVVRAHLQRNLPWFSHHTPIKYIKSIRRCGLIPQKLCTLGTPPSVRLLYGHNPNVFCLSPFQLSNNWAHLSHQDGPLACLAVRTDDLPSQIGLDWTFPETWNLAAVKSSDDPSKSEPEVFLEVVTSAASLVSYVPIDPGCLRVRIDGRDREDPMSWPKLVDTSDDELAATYNES